jgi:hypothetical protein
MRLLRDAPLLELARFKSATILNLNPTEFDVISERRAIGRQ